MDKVKCPTCQKPAYRHGRTRAGSQRFRCSCCDRTFTPDRKSPGRPSTHCGKHVDVTRDINWANPTYDEYMAAMNEIIAFLESIGNDVKKGIDEWDI